MKYGLFIAAAAFFVPLCDASAANVIGALQEIAADDSHPPHAVLRVLFVKKTDEWTPYCAEARSSASSCWYDMARETRWTALYHGAIEGTAVATPDAAPGVLRVAPSAPPFVGARSHLFAGWLDKPVHRPLVVTLTSPSAAPPSWREVDAESGDAKAMLPILAAHEAKIPDCSTGDSSMDKGRAPAAGDIRIAEVWMSANGERIVSASLKPSLVSHCDYTADLLADVWARDDGHGGLHALPALIASETTHAFVDAGDFAQDGREELLFWSSGYNEDGFVLIYDHFARSARSAWHYN